jgi:hypothetical protein
LARGKNRDFKNEIESGSSVVWKGLGKFSKSA